MREGGGLNVSEAAASGTPSIGYRVPGVDELRSRLEELSVARPDTETTFAEIEAAARQSHPGVVQLFEVRAHEGRPFLVMEYCPGGSLAERLRGGPLPFREAGLDMANFQPVASTWVPLHAYDARAAWDGADPAQPDSKIHVEAAAFHGRLIYFETIYPWDQPARQEQPPESGSSRALTFILITVYLIVLLGSALLARRNLRLGRGDRRGAARVACFYFTVRLLVWLFVGR